jgi:ABC-type phosphate transport system ATPase subunit
MMLPRSERATDIAATPLTTALPPKIRVSHLSFYYGQVQALHDISMAIQASCITVLIGPSGCGKSTFCER